LWTCPFCDRGATVTESSCKRASFSLELQTAADGNRLFKSILIVCPNPQCKKFTFTLRMYEYDYRSPSPGVSGGWKAGRMLQEWNLIPPSNAKVFPEYVPEPIRNDYVEACLIKDLSPKASATLSRRCLQGMIRNFWVISKNRLVDEIDAIKDKTDPLTWDAIDAVRKIGNIGAHMEKDINVILDVDPDEAQLLIGLIELLVKDWYIAKHDREERLRNIVAVSEAKTAAKDRDERSER
jgi:Domain of unknown function (DUF4145)